MAIYITGPDANAPSFPVPLKPIKRLTGPSVINVTGAANDVAALADGSTSSYIATNKAENYLRYTVGSYTLPQGARVSSVSPSATMQTNSTNSRNDWLIGVGDHSGAKYTQVDNPPFIHYPATIVVRTFAGASVNKLANKQPITQADLERGLILVFGANTIYGKSASNPTVIVYDAKLQLSYDMAPTATITGVAAGGTINDTASPTITWDYFDDFQPQTQFQLFLKDSGGNTVYDSGLVTSRDTSHQVAKNLANGTYSVSLRVYQAWNGSGGAFSSLGFATSSFTVSVLRLNAPVVSTSVVNEHAVVTVTPNVNLLNYDASTFDRDVLQYTPNNVSLSRVTTPVKDGISSGKVTWTATGSNTLLTNAYYPVTPSGTYSLLASVQATHASMTAFMYMQWYDVNGAPLTTSSGSAQALTANSWISVSAQLTAPATAVFGRLGINFGTLTSVSDVLYVDDIGLFFTVAGSTPAWSRGGFFETTPNLLTYDDSSFEGDSWIWQLASGSLGSVATSTTQAVHGSRALAYTAAAVSTASLQLGTNQYFACTPGSIQRGYFKTFANAANRQAQMVLKYYDANGVFLSNGTTAIVAAPNGSWSPASPSSTAITAPANAATFAVTFNIGASTGSMVANEVIYLDAIAVYTSSIDYGYLPGYFPNTDESPTLFVEYTEDNVTWKSLDAAILTSADAIKVFNDYSIRSGMARTYRAYMSETENTVMLASDYSATASATITLAQVWMNTDADPAGTSYHFQFDGAGRSRVINALPQAMDIEGREYGFSEFSTSSFGQIAVTLQLPATTDQAALRKLALAKSEVVFRDQRGRSHRGVLGPVTITDEIWGQTATFTMQLTGVQP